MSDDGLLQQRWVRLGASAAVVLVVLGAVGSMMFGWDLERLLTVGFVNRSLQMATPITLAAIGGLYAEKSGVFNIGLEGFMIIGAISTAGVLFALGGTTPSQGDIWIAMVAAVLVSLVLTAIFAVLLIDYQADQIVAGLAVWFIGLGFAPFVASLVWGSRNSPGLASIDNVTVPGLSEIPWIGPVVFDQSPLVLLTLVLVIASWVFLYRTRYGYWVQAAGENPKALDTAGVNVTRVRYATVLFSGAMAGFGGAVLLAHAGNFVGTGDTMVNGRGWIAIVAYLFGNYNPLGAAAAAVLFGGLDMLQVQFQTAGIDVPSRLVNLFPYVIVIVVLSVWGKTRMPSAVGESYDQEE
ncbi:simple sugar transport system permease protein [Halorubrum alkaliphilum]|uniref:Simple sugar transport system permease protein n=1 Tax=Halorubrum alkaliphilum TaxID=261290 RepID=A0A8T4GBW0_9EURY|nr:simple sugar transport system permease protein [Halorubrum alkaliphilum]